MSNEPTHNPQSQDELDELLGAYLDGELVDDELAHVEGLIVDSHIQNRLEQLRSVSNAVRGFGGAVESKLSQQLAANPQHVLRVVDENSLTPKLGSTRLNHQGTNAAQISILDRSRTRQLLASPIMAVAAGLLVVALVGGTVIANLNRNSSTNSDLARQTTATSSAEKSSTNGFSDSSSRDLQSDERIASAPNEQWLDDPTISTNPTGPSSPDVQTSEVAGLAGPSYADIAKSIALWVNGSRATFDTSIFSTSPTVCEGVARSLTAPSNATWVGSAYVVLDPTIGPNNVVSRSLSLATSTKAAAWSIVEPAASATGTAKIMLINSASCSVLAY